LAFGITDTDDANIELERGAPIEIIYPDQGEGGMGALFIPNTVAIVKGGPNPEAARKLIDYLLGPEVETRLARGRSAQFPLNPEVRVAPRVQRGEPVKRMQVDFAAAAEQWEEAAKFLRDEFAAAD
jgi:iron(III) transport system substrate-binding protein